MKHFKCLSWVLWTTTISGENCCHLVLADLWADSEDEPQACRVVWIVFKTKTVCLKSLKPFKQRPEHCNASGNDSAWCWKSLWEDVLYVWEASEREIQPSLQNNSALHDKDHSELLWALYGTQLSEMEQLELLSCWLWIPNPVYAGTKGDLFASLCFTMVTAKFWENLKYLYNFRFFFCVNGNWKWREVSSALTFLYSKSRIIRNVIEWLF